jgi:hypothetical protein
MFSIMGARDCFEVVASQAQQSIAVFRLPEPSCLKHACPRQGNSGSFRLHTEVWGIPFW